MHKLFNPSDREIYITAISYILFGLLLCLLNVSILTSALQILGIIFLIISAYLFFIYFIQRTTLSSGPLFIGIIQLICGIFMISSPKSILSILPIIAGFLFILNAITHLQKAFILKDYGCKNWTINLIISLIILLAGIVLLFKPIQSLSFILQMIGIFFIVEAIFMLIIQHTIKQYY